MAFINWSPALETKFMEIDLQHKKLVDLVNKLYDAMAASKGNEVMGPLLNELLKYTVVHFQSEERLMQSNAYPDMTKHKQLHEELKNKVLTFKQRFDSGQARITIEVMNFLKDWLAKHIQGDDVKLGGYLNSKKSAVAK
ncbi:MAG: Bacteriohemerythrin [Phycisphaerae bacterium]|nr:Bacteriohemerythrin [Phycisphaerae bacterium]